MLKFRLIIVGYCAFLVLLGAGAIESINNPATVVSSTKTWSPVALSEAKHYASARRSGGGSWHVGGYSHK